MKIHSARGALVAMAVLAFTMLVAGLRPDAADPAVAGEAPLPTATATGTPVPPTATATATATVTPVPPTATATATATVTPVPPTATATATPAPSIPGPTATATATPAPSIPSPTATATPTPTPLPEVAAAVVKPTVTRGETQTGYGHGFAPGETVSAEQQSTPLGLGTAVADAAGTAEFVWTIRSDESLGTHHFVVTGESGTASATFEVVGPDAPTPGPTAAPTPTPGDALPATGRSVWPIVMWASAAVLIGSLFVALRRPDGTR